MVDKPKLDQMLANLKKYVQVLTDLARSGKEEFLGDSNRIGNAKYHFVVAIECCIDIANHIIASNKLRLPSDNADTFTVLVEAGVCPGEMAPSLKAMARFRNRLVHLYWQVDDELVFDYLQSSIGDLSRFGMAASRVA